MFNSVFGILPSAISNKTDVALEDECKLLRTLIDYLPDTIYAKDTQGRFFFKTMEEMRLMGATSPEEVIAKTDFDFYPPGLATRYQADDQAVIQAGQPPINREQPIISATGGQHWLLTTKVPRRTRQGEIVGLVRIGHDITDNFPPPGVADAGLHQDAIVGQSDLSAVPVTHQRTDSGI